MKKTPRVLVPLAHGFEEIEAVTIIDVLRRGGIEVRTAGLVPGPARGAHGIEVGTDEQLGKVDAASFDMLVLPGGMPGAQTLKDDARVIALVQQFHGSGRHVAAICAAPMVLAHAGVLAGVPATAYPGFREKLTGAQVVHDQRVVRSGKVMTSQGPGTAMEFALAIVSELSGKGVADELARGMLVRA